MRKHKQRWRWHGMAGLSNLTKKFTAHRSCAVANCFNRTDNRPDIPYHKFPADKNLCKQWEIAIRRDEEAFSEIKHRFVCGEHFLPTDYRRSLTGRHILASGTIPSVFKSQNNTTFEDSPSAKRLKPETASETPESDSDPGKYRYVPVLVPSVFVFNVVEHDTDTQRLEGLENELVELRAEAKVKRECFFNKVWTGAFLGLP